MTSKKPSSKVFFLRFSFVIAFDRFFQSFFLSLCFLSLPVAVSKTKNKNDERSHHCSLQHQPPRPDRDARRRPAHQQAARRVSCLREEGEREEEERAEEVKERKRKRTREREKTLTKEKRRLFSLSLSLSLYPKKQRVVQGAQWRARGDQPRGRTRVQGEIERERVKERKRERERKREKSNCRKALSVFFFLPFLLTLTPLPLFLSPLHPSQTKTKKVMTVDEWSSRWKRNDDFPDCLHCGSHDSTRECHFVQTWCRAKKCWEAESLCMSCLRFSWRSYRDPDFKTPEQYEAERWAELLGRKVKLIGGDEEEEEGEKKKVAAAKIKASS